MVIYLKKTGHIKKTLLLFNEKLDFYLIKTGLLFNKNCTVLLLLNKKTGFLLNKNWTFIE